MLSSSSDEESEPEPTNWVDAHFYELSDLYAQLKEHGQQIFGGAFLQHSDFGDFVNFVQRGTLNSSNSKVQCRPSGYLGLARRLATSSYSAAK